MELLKTMQHYFELNQCYPGNEYWSKLFEKAFEADNKSFPLGAEVMQKIAKIIDKEIADYEREIKIWNDCLEPEESTKPMQDRKNIIGVLKTLKLKIASNFSA